MIEEIIPGVFTSDHQVAEGKNAVIFGQKAVLAIDSGTYPQEGQVMVDFIREHGRDPNHLLYTHGHGDHVMGSSAFQGAQVFAHAQTPAEIERILPGVANRFQLSVAETKALIAWPTITFSDELCFDLGDKQVRLFPTPGHSQDGISLYLEKERLLIAGDAVVTSIVPAIGDGDSRILEASLQKLLALDIEILLPGHGRALMGAEQVQDWLQWVISYLQSVRSHIQAALKQGQPPDDIIAQINYDATINGRLPKDKHAMPQRHQATVTKIVSEELDTPS